MSQGENNNSSYWRANPKLDADTAESIKKVYSIRFKPSPMPKTVIEHNKMVLESLNYPTTEHPTSEASS